MFSGKGGIWIGCNEGGCGSLVCKSVECSFSFQMDGSFVIENTATIYVLH